MMSYALAVSSGLVALAVLAASPAASQPSPAARGEAIATTQCARCHSVADTGASPMRMAPPFRDLSKRYPLENLAEALAEGIVTGHPTMPEFRLEPDQIHDLLSFLKTLE